MRFRISSTRQAVVRGPSFIGLGKRPDFTPAHQVLFETGMIAGIGGLVFELPIMCDSRTKPDAGKIFDIGMDFI
jgi:hypothetical protein